MRLLPLVVGACCNLWSTSAARQGLRLRSSHTPWASIRALLGSSSTHEQAPQPPLAPPPGASALPAPLPPSPAPAPGMLGAPGAVQPMPMFASQQLNGAPAAAPMSASPACYACLPNGKPPEVNGDLKDVAAEEATSSVNDAAEEAEKDAEATIAEEGRKSQRSVEKAGDKAADEAADKLKQEAEGEAKKMEADSNATMTAAEQDSHVAAEFGKMLTSEGISMEGAQASAKYIADAQTAVRDLVKDIKKAGKAVNRELKSSASIGKASTNETEKFVQRAENYTYETHHFMDETLEELHQAQIDANFTEDAVRVEALGTKYTTQAVTSAKEESKKAQDMATHANLTAKFIITKVMKTKQGIVDATSEVDEAITKAENAHLEAQSAEFQAGKLLKNAPR